MTKKDEIEIDEIERSRIESEIERIREVWEKGREERDLRNGIEFKNRATWTMFQIVDGGEMSLSYGDMVTNEDAPLDDDAINRLEKTAADCPFAHDSKHGRPYFQEGQTGGMCHATVGQTLAQKMVQRRQYVVGTLGPLKKMFTDSEKAPGPMGHGDELPGQQITFSTRLGKPAADDPMGPRGGSSFYGREGRAGNIFEDELMKTLAPMGGQTPHPPKNGGERATPGPVLPYPAQPFEFNLKQRGMR